MKYSLVATTRQVTGRKVKNLRSKGILPASIFGKKISSVSIQVDAKEFLKIYKQVGESTLLYIQLDSDKNEKPTLVSEVVYHPVSGLPVHVAFMQVDLKEKVTAPVKLKIIGESLAEKDGKGILVQQLDEVEISALPTDMPENIEVDVSVLVEVDQSIFIKDLKLNSKLEIKSDLDTIIAKIEPLAKEEAVEPVSPTSGETPTETPTESPTSPVEESKSE